MITRIYIENEHCYSIDKKKNEHLLYVHNKIANSDTLIGKFKTLAEVECEVDKRTGRVRDKVFM